MSQAYNLMFANKGVTDSHMHSAPTATQFTEGIVQHTMSVEWHKEIIGTENGSSNGIAANSTQAYTSYNLHDTGDVLSSIVMQTSYPALVAYVDDDVYKNVDHMHLVNAAGYAQFRNVSLKIGNNEYDNQDSVLMYLLEEIQSEEPLIEETGNYKSESLLINAAKKRQIFQVPLKMWCFKDVKDSLKLCAMANNSVILSVYFDLFQNFIVNRGGDVWGPALIANVKNQLAQASSKLIGRYHFLEESERTYYTNKPMMSIFTMYQTDQRTLPVNTTADSYRLQFNFPVTAFLFVARNSAAMDGTSYYPGKIGTKDKFWFGTPTGVEPLTDLDVKINNNPMLAGYGQNGLFMRTHAIKHGFGSKSSQPVYALPFQPAAHSRANFSSLNCSRFDNINVSCKLGHTATGENTLFYYGVSRNIMTQDTGYVNKPLAA